MPADGADAAPDAPRDDEALSDGGAPRDGGVHAPLDGGAPDAASPDGGTVPHDAGEASDACGDGACGEGCNPCPLTCPAGLVAAGGSCVPRAPLPFASRTEAEVCDRFRADHVAVWPEWEPTPGSDDPCDPGIVPDEAHENGIRRTNLYRWLAGLAPVTSAEALREQQQACAVLLAALGHLTHHPSSDAPCYSEANAAGAGSSNLAMGGGLAGSVDLYVADYGVSSLGHRRWVLNPSMQETAFGAKGSFSCMYAFSGAYGGGSTDLAYVAWPPPGYVPLEAARGRFSLTLLTLGLTEETRVWVALDDGAFEEVAFDVLPYGYGQGTALAFEPPAESSEVWSDGRVVRIRITGTTQGDFEHTTVFVDCI